MHLIVQNNSSIYTVICIDRKRMRTAFALCCNLQYDSYYSSGQSQPPAY